MSKAPTAEPQHSRGPWEYNDPAKFTQGHGKFSETAVYAAGNAFPWRMAEVVGPDNATAVANARLIAASPALLRACQAVAHAFDGPGARLTDAQQIALSLCREAVAGATGTAEGDGACPHS
jgi:hypothetical protein